MMDIQKYYDTLDDPALSLVIVCVTVYLCNLMRFHYAIILRYTGLEDHEYRFAIIEMIGTIEISVIAFELNFIVYDIYGTVVYAFMIFVSVVWQVKRNTEFKYYANPAVLAAKYIKAKQTGPSPDNQFSSFIFSLIMLVGELAGAAIAYYFIVYVAWRNAHHFTFWRSSNYHMKRFKARNNWGSSIQTNVPFAMGVEGLFSFLNYLTPSLVKFHTNLTGDTSTLFINALKGLFCGLGANFTGSYYNPVMATPLEYTTHGHSHIVQALVYWVAPIVGTIAAMLLS